MDEYTVQTRSLESVSAEVKRAIEGHGNGNSEGYDTIKEIFVPRKEDDEGEKEGLNEEMKVYLLALTSHASMLNKGCSGLVKSILSCEWMGREYGFVKVYVNFLGSLASAQGCYVGTVLGMLVEHFHGGTFSTFTILWP